MAVSTLRRATPADAAAIGAVHAAAWQETYAGLLPVAMLAGMSVDAQSAMWRSVLDAPAAFGGAAVFIGEDGGRVIGFGACGRQRDDALAHAGFSGEFGAIYVLRSHQGCGVGRSIMAAMAEDLSARGHKAACLWVLRQNVSARGFYEKLGGVIVDRKIDARPDGTIVEHAYGWRDIASLCG